MLKFKTVKKAIEEYPVLNDESLAVSNVFSEQCAIGAIAVHQGFSYFGLTINSPFNAAEEPYKVAAKALGLKYSNSEDGPHIDIVWRSFDMGGINACIVAIKEYYQEYHPEML